MKFINDMENVLLETDSGATTQAAYTLEPMQFGNLISQRRAGATSFHHFDALGSTERLTDSAEAAVVQYMHKAFGLTSVLAGSSPNRHTWIGRLGYRWEPDAEHYDVRRRRLFPGIGRWLSADPGIRGTAGPGPDVGRRLGDVSLVSCAACALPMAAAKDEREVYAAVRSPGTHHNVYVYAGNRPLYLADPSGLECVTLEHTILLGGWFPLRVGIKVCRTAYEKECCRRDCVEIGARIGVGIAFDDLLKLLKYFKDIDEFARVAYTLRSLIMGLATGAAAQVPITKKKGCPPKGTHFWGEICVTVCLFGAGATCCAPGGCQLFLCYMFQATIMGTIGMRKCE